MHINSFLVVYSVMGGWEQYACTVTKHFFKKIWVCLFSQQAFLSSVALWVLKKEVKHVP